MTEEVWKPIPNFSSFEASNHGRVRRVKPAKTSKTVPAILQGTIATYGYRYVRLTDDSGRRRNMTFHRLVLLSHVGLPPFERADCCHNNGDRLDNRLENLRWGTRKSNIADMVTHGTAWWVRYKGTTEHP